MAKSGLLTKGTAPRTVAGSGSLTAHQRSGEQGDGAGTYSGPWIKRPLRSNTTCPFSNVPMGLVLIVFRDTSNIRPLLAIPRGGLIIQGPLPHPLHHHQTHPPPYIHPAASDITTGVFTHHTLSLTHDFSISYTNS